jgi:hypothetical protein
MRLLQIVFSIIFYLSLLSPLRAGDPPPLKKLKPTNSGVPFFDRNVGFKSPFANPNPNEKPIQVRVGFLLLNVTNYNLREGKFEADFYLSYSSDKPMPHMNPHLTNGYIEEDDLIRTIADEPTFKMWKIHAIFYNYPDLRNYPFDMQELTIEIEEDDSGIDTIVFIPVNEISNFDSDFQMPGWNVRFTETRVLNHYYPDRFDHDDLYYPRYIFRIGISRFSTNAIFTVFLPSFVIMLVSLSAIWLKPNQIEAKINSTAPMLAAAVLFHYTLIQELPATPYLTRADKLMMSVYLCLVLNMFASWAYFFISEKYYDGFHKYSGWLIPPLNLVLFAGGSFL